MMGTALMIVHMHLLGRMYCLLSPMNPASGAADVAFHLSGGLGAAVSVNAMRGLVAMRGNLPQAMFVQGYQVGITTCECGDAGCMLCWSLAPQLCKAGRSTQLHHGIPHLYRRTSVAQVMHHSSASEAGQGTLGHVACALVSCGPMM
jgi:hypothetical protein